jgi:hypothetical protein
MFFMASNNQDKNRKSKEQEIFEQVDNAGRFAGNDSDAKAAKEKAVENIRQDTNSTSEERNNNDEERDADQSKDFRGESQNVKDDSGGRLRGEEATSARDKAEEGIRQKRDD